MIFCIEPKAVQASAAAPALAQTPPLVEKTYVCLFACFLSARVYLCMLRDIGALLTHVKLPPKKEGDVAEVQFLLLAQRRC